MRKTKTFEGKKHIYDTEKAEVLGNRAHSYYGDPAGYEETLYKTKGGLFFLWGLGGADSPYNSGEDIRPISEKEAKAWLKAKLFPEEMRFTPLSRGRSPKNLPDQDI